MIHTVYLSLGTNLGDRSANLEAAQAALPPGVRVLEVSPIYETQPWGYQDQPNFLNQVLKGQTDLSPMELLKYLKRLETELGRLPSFKNGPRLIDVDILLYDHLVMDTLGLTIPHPGLLGRAFVLVPLSDLAPDLVHPIEGKSIQELLQGVDRKGINPYPRSHQQENG